MKSFGRLLALFALLGAKPLFAAIPVGDNAELFVTGSVALTIDDNIYLRSSNKVDDMIMTYTPGIDLIFGRNSQTSGRFFYRHDILRYADVSQQNTNLANLGFNSVYSNGKTKFDFGASFNQTAQNEPSVPGAIVERDSTRVRANSEFGISQKTLLGVGLNYEDMSYAQNVFFDSTAWTLPLDVYFEYSPKLQMSFGYRYRVTDVSLVGADTRDHFFNIGARGEFTPKLMGHLRIGYNSRDYRSNRSDDSRLGLDADLNYSYSQKTMIFIRASNDFGTSAVGDSTKDFTLSLGVTNRVDEQWAWNAQLTFRSTDYASRSDDYFQGGVGATYQYNEKLSFGATYTHRKNDSSSQFVEFRNNVFSLTANFRY